MVGNTALRRIDTRALTRFAAASFGPSWSCPSFSQAPIPL